MSRAEIVARAEKITIDDALLSAHDMVKHGCDTVPSDIALKLVQEVYELRRKVEPQNADRQQIVHALERARIRLQTEADELHDRHDYSAEFPAGDAKRMEEAIAILTMPKQLDPAVVNVFECMLRAINDLTVSGSEYHMRQYAEGWIRSWANALRNAGYKTDSQALDILHALTILGERT